MSQPGVPAAPQTSVGVVLQEPLDISKSSPLHYCFQVLQHTLLGVSEKKPYRQEKKIDFFMKTAIEESSNLIARLNFMGFEVKVFRCKNPHSLSSSIKRPFCPVLIIPSRGLTSVLPSEGFLINIPEVYAGQSKHLWPSRLILRKKPHYYFPYKHWGPKLKNKAFYLVSFMLKK